MVVMLCRALDALTPLKLDPIIFATVVRALAPVLVSDEKGTGAPAAVEVRARAHDDLPKTKRRKKTKAKARAKDKRSGEVDRAVALLQEQLAGGPKSAVQIEAAAERVGLSDNALGRGRSKLGVHIERERHNGGGPVMVWSLPA